MKVFKSGATALASIVQFYLLQIYPGQGRYEVVHCLKLWGAMMEKRTCLPTSDEAPPQHSDS